MVQDKHLPHIREPSDPSERDMSPSTLLMDFEAMYLRRAVAELHGYDGDELAGAYADYIDEKVLDNRNRNIRVYAHTREATETLQEAIESTSIVNEGLRRSLQQKVHDLRAQRRVNEELDELEDVE